MADCPTCGLPVPEGARFCAACGGKVPVLIKQRICKMCGNTLSENDSFCSVCGTPCEVKKDTQEEKEDLSNPTMDEIAIPIIVDDMPGLQEKPLKDANTPTMDSLFMPGQEAAAPVNTPSQPQPTPVRRPSNEGAKISLTDQLTQQEQTQKPKTSLISQEFPSQTAQKPHTNLTSQQKQPAQTPTTPPIAPTAQFNQTAANTNAGKAVRGRSAQMFPTGLDEPAQKVSIEKTPSVAPTPIVSPTPSVNDNYSAPQNPQTVHNQASAAPTSVITPEGVVNSNQAANSQRIITPEGNTYQNEQTDNTEAFNYFSNSQNSQASKPTKIVPGKTGSKMLVPIILIILIIAVILFDVFFLFKDQIFNDDASENCAKIIQIEDYNYYL